MLSFFLVVDFVSYVGSDCPRDNTQRVNTIRNPGIIRLRLASSLFKSVCTIGTLSKLRDKVYKEIADRPLPIIKERHSAYFKSYF